jgi:hypothetical protein
MRNDKTLRLPSTGIGKTGGSVGLGNKIKNLILDMLNLR